MAITLNGTTGITTPDVDSTDLTATGNFTSRGIDDNATSTAMTLDSSGNLLVGTTSSFGSSGITLGSNKVIYAAASSQNVANFQRYTTDGEIVRFGKDGSTVGSIGTGGGDLYLTSKTGVAYYVYNGSFSPGNDNARDLGTSSYRFKDLYLSGGVYLGGTGSANHLDDYEEGTWTPSWKGGDADGTASGTFTGTYTKVGRLVYCSVNIQAANLTGASGALLLRDLPFTVSSTAAATGAGTAQLEGVTAAWINGTPQAGSHVQVMPGPNTVLASFRVGLSINWDSYLSAASTFTSGNGSTYGKISFTYQTD